MRLDTKIYGVLISLLIIDMLSTLWLNAYAPCGREVNPVMAAVLDSTLMFVLSKTLISCVVLGCLYRLSTQSAKVFKCASFVVCAFFGLVCFNNVVGVVVFW